MDALLPLDVHALAALLYAGHFFGNLPTMRERFELVILGILALSFVSMLWSWGASRLHSRAAVAAD